MPHAPAPLPSSTRVVTGRGGLTELHIHNRHARAVVALQGAQLLSFQPHGEPDWLYLSPNAVFAPGLHPIGRHGPDILVQVELSPPRAEDFARASRCQDCKFECFRSDRIALTEGGHEARQLLIGQGGVMAARELIRPRQ